MEHVDGETGEVMDVPTLEIECSAQVDKIFEALAKAQGKIENATKSASNEGFKRGNKASTYATLADVFEACRAALTENGIAVIQAPYNAGQDIGVATILGHGSGQWMKAKLQVKPTAYTAHGAGSVITYLRRYILSAMVGVAPEDDDGNAASLGAPAAASARGAGQAKPAAATQAAPAASGDQAAPQDIDEASRKEEAAAAYRALRGGIAAAPHTTALSSLIEEYTRNGKLTKLREFSEKGYDEIMASVRKREDMLRMPAQDPLGEELPA